MSCRVGRVFISSFSVSHASVAYRPSLVQPWFVFWRDIVKPKYPWRVQAVNRIISACCKIKFDNSESSCFSLLPDVYIPLQTIIGTGLRILISQNFDSLKSHKRSLMPSSDVKLQRWWHKKLILLWPGISLFWHFCFQFTFAFAEHLHELKTTIGTVLFIRDIFLLSLPFQNELCCYLRSATNRIGYDFV